VRKALRTHAPGGVNVFFDNVGGEILDAVLTRLARGARVVICGAVSQYNNTEPVRGPSNYLSLLVFRASVTGMVVFDYAARYGEAVAKLAGWMRAGEIVSREDVVQGGVEDFHDTLLRLFEGANVGKLVLRLGEG
jgi:NADPH-dependent curcumin reductase CurA